jgi:hypothetical protein
MSVPTQLNKWIVSLGIFTFTALPLTADEPNANNQAWAYSKIAKPQVPAVKAASSVQNLIDAFILARLEKEGLTPSARSDKLMLLRRVTFDLTGLPPTPAEQEAFLKDDTSDAYAKVVDRLLASPRYGERWAQHWLDVVRYAETDGFKADDLRPNAYRYRDFVIRALNEDMPYDRFVRLQLAGDELEPDNPDALIATGFLRLGPDEYNSATLELRRQEILDDVTEVTGFAFLGLTFGCARCHDHKFDPILQADFFRLQSFFAALRQRDDLTAADPETRKKYLKEQAAWEKASEPIRKEMESLVAEKREEVRRKALDKFRQEIKDAELTPAAKRSPYQTQIALLAEKQMDLAAESAPAKLSGDKKKRYQELEKQLAAVEPKRPKPLAGVLAASDIGREAPPTFLLSGGDWRKPRKELALSFPRFLGSDQPDTSIDSSIASTGRRAALARWLTQKDHPLTARVIVNRLWQHHFGRGLVGTPNDFGSQGDAPTHPKLLDWLATELVDHQWSLKSMHRMMVLSATYCQESLVGSAQSPNLRADPDNKLLWRANRQRLEGEAIRDALLCLSGDLNPRMFGPSAKPKLPDKISSYTWKADDKPEDQHRRSIYVLVKRNLRYPLFDAFDQPDLHNSCARRTKTTTAPQALLLLNSEFSLEQAQRFCGELMAEQPTNTKLLVKEAIQRAWGREAGAEEIKMCLRFIEKQADIDSANSNGPQGLALPSPCPGEIDTARAAALVDFCHALLNANEFLYVD